jgi:hypothetical protein
MERVRERKRERGEKEKEEGGSRSEGGRAERVFREGEKQRGRQRGRQMGMRAHVCHVR